MQAFFVEVILLPRCQYGELTSKSAADINEASMCQWDIFLKALLAL